jgi:hypothetical protein
VGRAKAFLRAVLPSVVVSAARRIRDRLRVEQPEWEYVPEGWTRQRRDPQHFGWEAGTFVDAHRAIWDRWLEAVAGTGPLGVDFWWYMREAERGGEFERNMGWAHNFVMTFGYVLARTAQARQAISVLDWGSGVGQYYPLARALLPNTQIDYHCKDVPTLTTVGGNCFRRRRSTTTIRASTAPTTSSSPAAGFSTSRTGRPPFAGSREPRNTTSFSRGRPQSRRTRRSLWSSGRSRMASAPTSWNGS